MESSTCCHLTENQLQQIRQKLKQMKPELPAYFISGQSGHCISDLAADTEAMNLATRLADRDRKLYLKICETEKRIDAGSYGICQNCGDPIDWHRLEARPITVLCLDCKIEQERREQATPRDIHWGNPRRK